MAKRLETSDPAAATSRGAAPRLGPTRERDCLQGVALRRELEVPLHHHRVRSDWLRPAVPSGPRLSDLENVLLGSLGLQSRHRRAVVV